MLESFNQSETRTQFENCIFQTLSVKLILLSDSYFDKRHSILWASSLQVLILLGLFWPVSDGPNNWRIQNPLKPLRWSILIRWSVLRRLLTPYYFCKTLHLRCLTGFLICLYKTKMDQLKCASTLPLKGKQSFLFLWRRKEDSNSYCHVI